VDWRSRLGGLLRLLLISGWRVEVGPARLLRRSLHLQFGFVELKLIQDTYTTDPAEITQEETIWIVRF